jgi:hypothetical protein
MDIRTACKEVYDYIVQLNKQEDNKAIPHSDQFMRDVEATVGINRETARRALNILKESHYILVIEIEKEEPNNNIQRIEGYVQATVETITRLKGHFQKQLEHVYEKERGQHLMVHQIIKEIFPRMQSLKGTAMGQVANKAIMLEEYSNLLQRHYQQYSPDWKEEKFEEIIRDIEGEEERKRKEQQKEKEKQETKKEPPSPASEKTAEEEADGRRATDTREFSSFKSLNNMRSINRVLNIYGVDFFFRANIRNCNFDLIREVVESGALDRRSDILKLKEMLGKVRSNMDSDPELCDHQDELTRLERSLTRFRLTRHL